MKKSLPRKIPSEGAIEIETITNLAKNLLWQNIHQSTITTDQIPEEHLQNVIIKAQRNHEQFDPYIVEHHGHFVLLSLEVVDTGIKYAIYDSLAHTQNGNIRKESIAQILRNTFFNATVTYDPDKYVKVMQGANHAIIDADNCGLTSIFAQFIYNEFGEKFPTNIFINNPFFYTKLNDIAQKMRGKRDIDIDQITQELTILVLEIADNPKNFQHQNSEKPFIILDEIDTIAQIVKKSPNNQDLELLYAITPKFSKFLEEVLDSKNRTQINEKNLNFISTIYKLITQEFYKYQNTISSKLNEEFSNKAKYQDEFANYDELMQIATLSEDLTKIFYFFYEIRKNLSDLLSQENKDKLRTLGYYDPVLNLATLVAKTMDAENQALQTHNSKTKILNNYESKIELALILIEENKDLYEQSEQENVKILLGYLRNQRLKHQLTESIQISGENPVASQELLQRSLQEYAANNKGNKVSNLSSMALMFNYTTNNDQESLKGFGSRLTSIKDEKEKYEHLKIATKMLIRKANSNKESPDQFKIIYELLTNKGLSHFIDQNQELRLALLVAKQNLYKKSEKPEYKTSPEEFLAIDLNQLSEVYLESYLDSIFQTQNIEKSKETILRIIDTGIAENQFSKNFTEKFSIPPVEIFILKSTLKFCNYFVYNENYPQYTLKEDSFKPAIEIHQKALEKIQYPIFRIHLLRSLFKMQFLSTDSKSSKITAKKIVDESKKNYSINGDRMLTFNAKCYEDYLSKEESEDSLEIDERLSLIKKIDPEITQDEERLIAQNSSKAIIEQQQELFRKTTEPKEKNTPRKEYVLKIGGTKVNLKSLPAITNDAGAEFKLHCPEELLNEAGDFKRQFEETLSKDRFAKAKGDDGVKFITNSKNGNIYEIKIKSSEARILGIETSFQDQNDQPVKLICFSKYLSTTKASSGRSNTSYTNARDNLTPPTITYEEKSPSSSPTPESSSKEMNPRVQQR